jgi:hypothetical protein
LKKIKWVPLIPMIGLALILSVPRAYGKGLEVIKKGGGYEFLINLDRDPPVIGDNPIEIGIRDDNGVDVKDAKVLVNYYMPPMPRMAPMNYTEEAKYSGSAYKLNMHFIMAGPWVIRVIVTHNEQRAVAKINVDAQ